MRQVVKTSDGIILENFMPQSFRIALAGLCLLPVVFIFMSDHSTLGTLLALTLVVLGLFFFLQAKVAIKVTGKNELHYGTFPFRTIIPLEEILGITVDPIPTHQRIEREWGGGGKPTSSDGRLFDAGFSTYSITIHASGNRIFKLGYGKDQQEAQLAADTLEEVINELTGIAS